MTDLAPSLEREIGNAGVLDPFGLNAWEEVLELQWPQSLVVLDRMRRTDGQTGSVLRAINLPIRRTGWHCIGSDVRPVVREFCERQLGLTLDARGRRRRRRQGISFDEHLRHALLMLPFGHCVDSETEALTIDGWKRGADVREGDLLYTLNPATGLGEWQPAQAVHRFSGHHAVRRFEGRSHSSVTTLNHRWITRDHNSGRLRFRTSAELTTGDRIIRGAPASDSPVEAKWSDAFVELVAWYWTEGHEHPGGGADIYQSETANPHHCARIRAALAAYAGPPSATLLHGSGHPVGGYRETTRIGGVSRGRVTCWHLDKLLAAELRSIAPAKVVAPAFVASLTPAQLRLFIETSIDADGTRTAKGRATLAQRSAERLAPFEMACALAGIPTTTYLGSDGTTWQVGLGAQTEIRPVMAARRGDGRMTDRLDVEDGEVWCPTVANSTWLARRRGTVYFTGNSVFEQVYQLGPPPPGLEGLPPVVAHLRKLSPRLPRTITRWKVARDGGLEYIRQASNEPGKLESEPIKIDRLVVYVHEKEGADWHGQSILRTAYKNWLIKDQYLRLSAVAADRQSMGLPVVNFDRSLGTRAEALEIGKRARVGEDASIALPDGYSFKLEGVTGATVDLLPWVKYHDEAIGRSALAMFLNLGHDNGARSLGETFVDFFTMSLQTVVEYIEEVLTEHVVRDLVEVNFGPDEPYPSIVADDIEADGPLTAEALAVLVNAGVILPDDDLETHVRRTRNLPPAMRADAGPGGGQIEVAPGVEPPELPPAPPAAPPAPPDPGAGPTLAELEGRLRRARARASARELIDRKRAAAAPA